MCPFMILTIHVLLGGGHLPGPENRLLSNIQKWIVLGDICADKARDFTGKGSPGGEQQSKGNPGELLWHMAPVSDFMMMGFVSMLSLANHSDSETFLVVHALSSRDGCQQEGFWKVAGHAELPFDPSWTLPDGGGLLVLCSLPGPPVLKQLMQIVTMVSGHGGWFQTVFFP